MPIRGKKIVCTRPAEDAEEFRNVLENSGVEVIIAPLIEIHSVEDFSYLDSKLDKLNKYKGIIFTSANGVKYFFTRANARAINPENEIYAVGEKTKQAVESFGYTVSFIPDSYNSASLAKLLMEKDGGQSKYLFPTGNLSMKQLVSELKNVDEVIVYETRKPLTNQSLTELEYLFNKNEIDCIAFFSPSAVSNFAELFPRYKSFRADIAVIGKTTLSRIEEIGLKANIIAERAAAVSLGEEIINYYNAG